MVARETIPLFTAREELTSKRMNQIVRAVNRTSSTTGGPGVKVYAGESGNVVSLDIGQEIAVFGRISAVAGGAGPDIATTFTYEFTAFARPELPVYTGMTPTGGRPVRASDTTTEIYPASVDSWAILILEPTGDGTTSARLYLMEHETLAFDDCAGAGAIGQPNDLDLASLLDHVLVDRSGDILVDRFGYILVDRQVNLDQWSALIAPVLTDRFGDVLTDRFGNTLLDRFATDEAHDLWDSALVDRFGEVLTDRNRCVLGDREAPSG